MTGYRTWFLLIGMFPLFMWGQGEIIKGQVVDSVPFSPENTLSYYVPSTYNEDRSWPVIYAFDPSGRDELAVKTFSSAAEKFGYVVVASDAIRNGSYQENYRHARDLFMKTEEMFKVDSVNRFTAGFSGGARLASAIAGLSNDISGVIAAGAGIHSRTASLVQNNPFIFIGLCGDEDFNLMEMQVSETILRGMKYTNELVIFEGKHEWPPSEVIEKALRDLTVIMFSRAQQKHSEEAVLQMYQDQMEYNRSLQRRNKLLWAYNDLEKMRDWYSIYDKDKEIKDEMRTVRKNRQYRSQRSEMKYIEEVEPLYLEEYIGYLAEDIPAGELEALGYWDQEMKQLDKSFTESKKEAYQKMSVRIKSMLEVVGLQARKELKEPEHYDQLLFTNIFLTLVNSGNQEAYLEVMRLSAAIGEYDIAFYYTEQLLETGFEDMDKLRNYPGIALLRIQPEFGELLEKFGLESRF